MVDIQLMLVFHVILNIVSHEDLYTAGVNFGLKKSNLVMLRYTFPNFILRGLKHTNNETN